jgi:hypothetical protein
MRASLLFAACLLTASSAASEREFATRHTAFDHPDGPYLQPAMAADFGNANPPAKRAHAAIRDGTLEVTFRAGQKVNDTGLGLHLRVPPREVYESSFRLRYPESFEAGLHGKMTGLSGGKGYDGGRGAEARANGDGWSVRLQFDARAEDVGHTLYLYTVRMPGKYGSPHGAGRFFVRRGEWHTYRIRVTMQTSADRADGRVEVWLDDAKQLDLSDLQFVTQESGRQIDRVRLELFPGGGGLTPTRDHIIQIDDFSWRALGRDPAAASR